MNYHELTELSNAFATAKAEREYLEQYRKSKKALLMKEAERDGHKTAAMQEREAYAHADYIALLDGLRDAIQREESARWQLELFKVRFETWRTKEATKRAEMSLR